MGSVEIKFTAKDLKQAARLQEEFLTQMGVLGYKLDEFRAIPNKNNNNKVDVTLVLVRKKR